MEFTQKSINTRVYWIYFCLSLFMLVLTTRLIYLQVYKHQELKEKADKRQRREIELAKKRGLITDRNNSILSIDTDSISLYANPKEYDIDVASVTKIAETLAPILNEDKDKLRKKLYTPNFIWLRRQMPISFKARIDKLDLPGIGSLHESKRVYPKKELAASLLGFTGIDNQGLTGIELSFDSVLTNKNDTEKIFLDGEGRELLSKSKTQVKTNKAKTNTVKLTLDEKIQHISERELKAGVTQYKAKRGLAIVMDLSSGDLLSLATYPTFDPNDYSKAKWDVMKNWGVTDFYEPGSTMKIFSISAALENKKLSINEKVLCPGQISIGGWTVHDHGASPGEMRYLTPIDIIKYSSNVGTSIVTRRMTPEIHRKMLEKFGFGKATDSHLSGEVDGLLPELPWVQSRQSTISFGQGVAVTPLQIVTAMSAIARGGIRVEPRIIKEIIGIDGKVIKTYKSKEERTLSKETSDKMRNLMIAVVEDKEGTGRAAKIPGYVLAGKTGTADKVENGVYSGNVMSSFLGFYPAENPKVLSFVLLDAPQTAHFASMTAVPIYRKIAVEVLKILKIPPTKPEELLEKIKDTGKHNDL